MEVTAKVCANVMGLSRAMLRDGSLEKPEDLRDFTLGFTQGKASFDFVDVGHGKERADSKIKGKCFQSLTYFDRLRNWTKSGRGWRSRMSQFCGNFVET
jgi:hypothetical protein